MTTMEPAPAPGVSLARTLRTCWPVLHVLTVSSAAICLAAVPAVLAGPGITPVALGLFAVLCWPLFAAQVRTCVRMALGAEVTLRGWVRELRRWPRDAGTALVSAAVGSCALLAWLCWQYTGSLLFLLGAAASVAIAVITCLWSLVMAAVDHDRSGWISTARRALLVTAARAVPVTATLVLGGLGLWACATWTASLLLLVPAPMAVLLASGVWDGHARLTDHEMETPR